LHSLIKENKNIFRPWLIHLMGILMNFEVLSHAH